MIFEPEEAHGLPFLLFTLKKEREENKKINGVRKPLQPQPTKKVIDSKSRNGTDYSLYLTSSSKD